MFDSTTIIAAVLCYMGGLFLLALWVERRAARGRNLANNPYVYTLSLAVYCTSWTFYGSVGKAATSGMLFLTVYLGPTIAFLVGWTLLRKMVRLKNRHRITSIADLISARYGKSQGLAALVTVMALVGIMPYIALQLKAIFSTFDIMTAESPVREGGLGYVIVGAMAIFTIIFGVRKLDPTERHEGMVAALAAECLVKLIAFLSAGIFVTFFLFDDFHDLFQRLLQNDSYREVVSLTGPGPTSYMMWTTYIVLGISAILFLPRQFHLAVVENSNEKHIRTALWLFPLYLLLITFFVLPIAMGGLLKGFDPKQADTLVLQLPLQYGKPWLALLVFIGGFSAAAGMIMVSSMTLSTMVTNHLLLPLVGGAGWLSFLRRNLLRCRWAAVALVLFLGFWFERQVGDAYMLVKFGMISFAAVLQFAPAVLGGLFWRRGNRLGAYLGLASGFLIWFYTLLLPSLAESGWMARTFIDEGLLGLTFLRPEQLFNMEGFDPLSHAVFWSMLFNIGLYVLGSYLFEPANEEQSLAEEFVGVLDPKTALDLPGQSDAYIHLGAKRKEIRDMLRQYFSPFKARDATNACLQATGILNRKMISIAELAALHDAVERYLAGSIGAAAAREAIKRGTTFSPRESTELSQVYGEILTQLKVTPDELKTRIDYYRERDSLLTGHARELEEQVTERDRQIVERIHAEEALRRSEERFRALVETIGDMIWEVDTDLRYTYASPKVKDILGYEPEELLGKTPFELMPPEERDRMAKLSQTYFETARPFFSLENVNLHKSGRRVSLESSGVPVHGNDGMLLGYRGVDRDITKRKQTEKERSRLEAQIQHTQKLESLGMLAGGIAHDFNNLLMGMMGHTDLALMDLPNHSTARASLLEVMKAAQRAAELARQMLAYSGRGKFIVKSINLNHIVTEIVSLLESSISKDAVLHYELTDDLPAVEVDVTQIRQVIMNLITNASEALGEEGGVIRISTGIQSCDHDFLKTTYLNRELPEGPYVFLEVADSGKGMNEEVLSKIFDPFFTTKFTGRGLGLAALLGIVHGHEGAIWVDSRPGEGTRFRVYFPALDRPFEALHEERSQQEPGPARGTILLVDDDEPVLDVAGLMLKNLGFSVISATGGVQAVELFQKHSQEIRCVLLDLTMPGMDGEEVSRELRRLQADVRILISSGYTEEETLSRFMDGDHCGFIQKPYNLEDLRDKLNQALEIQQPESS